VNVVEQRFASCGPRATGEQQRSFSRIRSQQTLNATGAEPITWSIGDGNLPNGLNLSDAGVISGIPTKAGTYNFTVKATNSAGTGTEAFSIIISSSGDGGGGCNSGFAFLALLALCPFIMRKK
jgi:Synergist-CTERM protein sorting domain-containing protein